jgi:FkbM family methyltransferase
MDATKITERTGLDIRVALAAKARALSQPAREAARPADGARDRIDANGADATGEAPASPTSAGVKTLVKRKLRSLARAVFSVLKPIARPIGFRIRAYLQSGPQVELRAQQDRLNLQQLHQNIAHDLESLKRSQQEAMERLLAVHTTHVLQEIQSMRESLRRNFSSVAHGLARQDVLAPQLERIETYTAMSAHRVAVASGNNEVLVRTESGYVLCPASDPALLSLLMETGELERGTRLLIQKLLVPGDTFVDAGANIGMHTLAAARAMQGRGRVLSFEPLPATCELLRKSVWINGFSSMVEVHQAAVFDRPGRHPLFLGSTSGHHSLYPLSVSTLEVPAPVEVPLVRIDDIIGPQTRVNLLKIDVEGAEPEAVAGAAATIDANPGIALIVEFGLSHLQRTRHSTEQWLQQFARFDFEVKVIDAETGALLDCSVQTLESTPSVNLLFARPHADAWARARGIP